MAEAKRRLAAILAADVAGYSRLMGDDEQATLNTLNAYRAVFREHIDKRDGRVVDTAGDSVLAVFDSVVEAVQCAVDVQADIEPLNADLPEARRMLFRVGVNLGDVIGQDDGTIYGDGVNIAARLEGLAEPGGLMISANAFEQIDGKVPGAFTDAGEYKVKNMARPVHAYRLGTNDGAWAVPPSLPSKPSIAVLAFDNMSGDAEQEYFADGIAEDLITALSGLRWLFVVARNSSFTYKGQAIDVKQVARELGVRYVVEGSVRRGGERVRISVQLIDAMTGNHVWAKRYDRSLNDIFALQDEITETITATIAPELEAVERDRAHRKPPGSLDAWEAYQRGMWHLYQFTEDDNLKARALLGDAARSNPDFAPLCAGFAYGHFLAYAMGYRDLDLETALVKARRAVNVDDRDAMAHFALGRVLTALGKVDEEIDEIEAAITLSPSFALAHYALGYCLTVEGLFTDAVNAIDNAIRLSPRDPALWAFEGVRSIAHAGNGDYANALIDARNGSRRSNSPSAGRARPQVNMVAVLELMGRHDEAQAALVALRIEDPGFSPEDSAQHFGFLHPDRHQWYLDALLEAGISSRGRRTNQDN
jgi:TolB-like protein